MDKAVVYENIEYSIDDLDLFKKKKIMNHYFRTIDIEGDEKDICIPTIEGDIKISRDENIYIIIGLFKDIYPISKETFQKRYVTIQDEGSDNIVNIFGKYLIKSKNLHTCLLNSDVYVFAKRVDSYFCVYEEKSNAVLYGNPGDYYVVAYEDTSNIYIVNNTIMEKTYELVKKRV